jgi:hypothetical protein
MAEGVRAGIDVIEDGRIAAEQYSELDGERVLVLDRRSGRMKHSGIQFGTTTFLLGPEHICSVSATGRSRSSSNTTTGMKPSPTSAWRSKRVSKNLNLVRSIYADWERGDFSHAAWAHPEMEYTIADGPNPGTWIGHMPKGFRDWTSAWEGYRVEAEGCRELDEERVLVLTRSSGRGKTSGIELAQIPTGGVMLFTSATARWRGSSSTRTATAPSPISVWRSRRCRSRTWRSCEPRSMRSNGMT